MIKWVKIVIYLKDFRGPTSLSCPREGSDIDLIVISEDFKGMNIRERLEILGLASGRIFEPIEALGYTPEEIKNKKESFLEEILKANV